MRRPGLGAVAGDDAAPFVQLAFDIVNVPIAAFVAIGWVRYLLRIVRGQPAELGLLFSGGDRTLRMIGLRLTTRIAVIFGLLLLIVPGLVLLTGWWLSAFELVDRDRGVFANLGGSWELTRGHKWSLVLLCLFSLLVVLLGLLFCGIGMFVSIAILAGANASLYLRLRGEPPVTRAGPDPDVRADS